MTHATSILPGRTLPTNADQLTNQLREAVHAGALTPGERLPTISEFSRQIHLPANVVSRAFARLQSEGLLVSRKRAGTYVRSRLPQTDPNGSPIVRTQVRVFALVGPELTGGYYPLLQRGLDFAASQRGYQIITSNTGNDVRHQADTILQLIDKAVAGAALVPATIGPSPAHHIRQLQRSGIPVVLLHRGIEGVQAPLLQIPAKNVGRLAAQQLIEAGHRRIAYCTGQRTGAAIGYENGFRETLEQAGIKLPDNHVLHGNITTTDEANYNTFEKTFSVWFKSLMARNDAPTALFTSFESIGEIAYITALQHGLRLPQDLSIVTVSGRERWGVAARRLSCVTLDEEAAGKFTAQLLDEMSREKRPLVDDTIFPIELGFDPAHTLATR